MAYVTPTTRAPGYVVLATNWNEFVNNFIAMAPDVYTTKGDLAPATAANALARLAAGANDTLLTAASGEATGLKWAALVINIVVDTSPQLGGNLDFNGRDASGIGHLGFLATQDASTGANDLDDYQEGVWTPFFQDDDRDDVGQTHDTQVGRFVKIGKWVFISGRISTSGLTGITMTDAVVISGLPFPSDSTSGNVHSFVVGQAGNLSITASENLSGKVDANDDVIKLRIWNATGGNTAFVFDELTTDGNLDFSGFYEV